MAKLMLVILLVLSFRLQHLRASRHDSSPLPSNPASNGKQIVHDGKMVKEETQIQEQDVTVANRLDVIGGGGFHSGGKFSTGFVVGYLIGRHHHHSHAVSNFCISPYYQFLATLIVLAIFILAN